MQKMSNILSMKNDKMIRPRYIISQDFGENLNNAYAKLKMKGHNGIDFVGDFKQPVQACNDGYVYKIFNKNNPDLFKYRAVCVLVDKGSGVYDEVIYGHLWDIYVDVGDTIVAGQTIGTEGNTGEAVYVNGKQVKDRIGGKGHHIHLQVRPVVQVDEKSKKTKYYLKDNSGKLYKDKEGHYYWSALENNGYHGCVNYSYNLYTPNIFQWLKIYTKVAINISKQLKR